MGAHTLWRNWAAGSLQKSQRSKHRSSSDPRHTPWWWDQGSVGTWCRGPLSCCRFNLKPPRCCCVMEKHLPAFSAFRRALITTTSPNLQKYTPNFELSSTSCRPSWSPALQPFGRQTSFWSRIFQFWTHCVCHLCVLWFTAQMSRLALFHVGGDCLAATLPRDHFWPDFSISRWVGPTGVCQCHKQAAHHWD